MFVIADRGIHLAQRLFDVFDKELLRCHEGILEKVLDSMSMIKDRNRRN